MAGVSVDAMVGVSTNSTVDAVSAAGGRCMREVIKLAVYVVALFIVAALLTPPLYSLGRWAVDTDLLPGLRPFGIDKYLNRALLITLAVSLWPFLRWLGLSSTADLQLRPQQSRRRIGTQLAAGFALGLGGLAIGAVALVQGDALHLRGVPAADKLALALGTGMAVATVEEVLFRGVLFGLLRRRLPPRLALLALTILFASLHLMRSAPGQNFPTSTTWLSGFAVVPNLFWQFREPGRLISTLLPMLVVGWILGEAVLRTGHLYLSLGLHAGWVTGVKVLLYATDRMPGADLWLGPELYTGLGPLLLLLATWLVLVLLWR